MNGHRRSIRLTWWEHLIPDWWIRLSQKRERRVTLRRLATRGPQLCPRCGRIDCAYNEPDDLRSCDDYWR